MSGKFIVIEGLEGAGKTTAINTVANILKQNHITDLVYTREPGGTPIAEALRNLIKNGLEDEPLTPKAELLMFYAARIQLIENVIKRARARGELDRIELESLTFFERIRNKYRELAQHDSSIITIDASQTLEQVTLTIEQTIKTWLDYNANT